MGPVGAFYGIFEHSRRSLDFGWRLKVSMNMSPDDPMRTRFKMKGEDGVYREAKPFTDTSSLFGQQVSLAVRFHRLRYAKKQGDDSYIVSMQAYAAEVKILGPATEAADDSGDETEAEEEEEEVEDINPY